MTWANADGKRSWSKAVVLALALCFAFAGPSLGDDREPESDHERARIAVESGNVVPLALILEKIESLYHGTVIEVELENEDDDGSEHVGGFLYEIKLLTPEGNLLKVELDARTMAVLRVRGRGADAAMKPGAKEDPDQ